MAAGMFRQTIDEYLRGETVPPIKYYEVEQTRIVKVAANDEQGALAVANEAFKENASGERDSWGHSIGRVEVTNINITREFI